MIVIVTVVLLCTTSQLTQADDSALTQYFPLSTGNRWVYKVQDTDLVKAIEGAGFSATVRN